MLYICDFIDCIEPEPTKALRWIGGSLKLRYFCDKHIKYVLEGHYKDFEVIQLAAEREISVKRYTVISKQ